MSFNDRQKAFEEKFKHDQELQFRVEVRRNKLVGLWAAELLGKKGDEAESYAREVISSDLSEPGIGDLVRKVMGDFQEANVELSEHRLRKKIEELQATAKQQIMAE